MTEFRRITDQPLVRLSNSHEAFGPDTKTSTLSEAGVLVGLNM